jgi:hypothetical protein
MNEYFHLYHPIPGYRISQTRHALPAPPQSRNAMLCTHDFRAALVFPTINPNPDKHNAQVNTNENLRAAPCAFALPVLETLHRGPRRQASMAAPKRTMAIGKERMGFEIRGRVHAAPRSYLRTGCQGRRRRRSANHDVIAIRRQSPTYTTRTRTKRHGLPLEKKKRDMLIKSFLSHTTCPRP